MPPAANLPVRPCDHCHRDYTPVRNNQKLCRPCRLLRSMSYWTEARQQKTSNCAHCNAVTSRLDRRAQVCGKCAEGPWRGHCICCLSNNAALERPEIPVCTHCARDPRPGARTAVLAALQRHCGTAPAERADPWAAALARVTWAAGAASDPPDKAIARAKRALGLDPKQTTTAYDQVADTIIELYGLTEPVVGI